MISKYVKEQKRYTQDELRKIFECTADETVQIIRKLKEYGIVKDVYKRQVLTLPLQQDFFPEQSASSLPVYL